MREFLIDNEIPIALGEEGRFMQPETYVADNGILYNVPVAQPEIAAPNLTSETFFQLNLTPEQQAFAKSLANSDWGIGFQGMGNINMPVQNGGATVKPDGTVILVDGTRILPETVRGETSNVVLNADGSATLRNKETIELNSLPPGSIVEPNNEVVTSYTGEVLGSVAEVKEVVAEIARQEEAAMQKEIEKQQVARMDFLDQLVNYIYSQFYKK